MSDETIASRNDTEAARRAARLNEAARDRTMPYLRPRNSATLILIDRSDPVPKVLLGRRHKRHRFLPGKFVFPGGRVERTDRLMPVSAPLHTRDTTRLMQGMKRPSAAGAAAFALAAIRETYEETGIMLGTRRARTFAVPPGAWKAFGDARVMPDLSVVHFVARAITPPGRPRRFDSRFFAAEIDAIAGRAEGFVGPEAELVELVWLPLNEARRLDMPAITAVALEELQEWIATGMSHDHPVPLYRMLRNRFVRDVL
jgi:8-oxo-dGTP pyrophosphatase MutT (NUDIX family)